MKIVDVTGTHAHRFGTLVAIMAPKPAVDIKRRFQTASLKLLWYKKPPFKKIYARRVVSYFYFSRAPRERALKIRQINSTILKVPDAALSC